MQNFQNYNAPKYADKEKFVEVEEGIYRTKDPYGTDEVYVTSLTFELEDDNFEGGCSPSDIPQTPFDDLLDEFTVHVTDFYEDENEASEVTCYQEFGSPVLEEIQNLRTIIGKRFYAVENPERDGYYKIIIADMSEPRVSAEEADDDNDEDNDAPAVAAAEASVKDFDFEYREGYGGVINEYLGSDKAVIIPAEIDGKKVKAIGDDAFAKRENLESVVISDGIQILGWDVFNGCKKLKNIIIPESVELFMGRVFAGTPWLKSKQKENPLVIVNGFLIDGKKCEGDVVIPDGVIDVASEAFCKCKGITSVSIPDGVTEIGHRAFQGCKALTSVTLPSTVTIIGEEAFEGCKALENLNSPDNFDKLENLYEFAFDDTPWLKNLIENAHNENEPLIIGHCLLDGRAMKGEVEIPDGITDIYYKAFYYNREITSVTIPESVKEIGRFTFQGCSALEEVEIEDGLKTIDDCAFHSCTALKEIEIPESVTEIGECAFFECESLEEADISDELSAIPSGAFCGCKSLERVYMGDSVTVIGSGAFKECTSLRLVQFPVNPESIGKGAFAGCTALESVAIPDSVSEMGEEAFMNCSALREVYLPGSLGVLFDSVFENCTSLEEVHFENGLRVIGTYAFRNCCNLKELDLPYTLKQINPLAFEACAALREVEIPERVFYFYLSAFRGTNCTVAYRDKEYSFVDINPAANVESLNNEDKIYADIFGKVTEVEVISTGDNQYDENGNHKPDGFALSDNEIAALNDFLKNVKLEDFVEQITEYCNERCEENGEEPIKDYMTQHVITINQIAVNVCKDNGDDDPEIALIGDCDCDEENGICIGFRGGELVGIEQQDWLL